MVKAKKILFLFILCILTLLGAYAPSKVSNNNFNPAPVSFKEEDSFNISHETTEFKADESYKDLELVDIGKDNEIYIRFDNSGKTIYATKNLTTNKDLILYESKNVFATALSGVYKDNLYVVETLIEGDKFISYVVLVNKQGNLSRYKIGAMDKIPYVQQVDNLLLINYESGEENQISSYLSGFDMNTNQLDIITKEKYKIHSSGTVTGNFILFAGGIDDSIYYQIVEYDNEDIEKEGKSHIYIINKNSKNNPEKIGVLDNKLNFISGNENSLITSDYIYEAPFYDSGKLYIKNNNEWSKITIPQVTAGNDIIGAEKISDKVLLIYTNEYIYIYDYENKKYIKKIISKKHSITSRLKAFQNNFTYLEKIDNKYFLHMYNYIESN